MTKLHVTFMPQVRGRKPTRTNFVGRVKEARDCLDLGSAGIPWLLRENSDRHHILLAMGKADVGPKDNDDWMHLS